MQYSNWSALVSLRTASYWTAESHTNSETSFEEPLRASLCVFASGSSFDDELFLTFFSPDAVLEEDFDDDLVDDLVFGFSFSADMVGSWMVPGRSPSCRAMAMAAG